MDRHDSGVDGVDASQLEDLLKAAVASSRKRAHLLLHSGHQDQVQRLLIALDPGTYVRAHKHTEQWEMLVLLRGRIDVLIFDDAAVLIKRWILQASAPVVQIPATQTHCAIAQEAGSLVMEIKPGPYKPNEFMKWAPAESESAACGFVAWAAEADIGHAWSHSKTAAR